MEIDDEGHVLVATAEDPGVDDGPYRSAVWQVGTFGLDSAGRLQLDLLATPLSLGRLDGLKVEAVAISGASVGGPYVGTDDEDYGAVLRRLPAGAGSPPAR